MDYAKRIVRELLLEEVAQNLVSYAIRKRHEVSFKYDSGDGDSRGKLERITVQPVAYGITKAGNPCFRAYQLNGSSESAEKHEGQIPGWRLFLLDRVVSNTWKDSGKVFKEPPMYNSEGDKTMDTVFVQADFKGSSTRYSKGGLEKFNKERHEKNVENNPYYDFNKQVDKKQIAPDYVLKNIQDTQKTQKEREKQWRNSKDVVQNNKGNVQSISDMSRQKDFGDDEQTETTGPVTKNSAANNNLTGEKTKPSYQTAQRNGPVYKVDNNEENLENNGFEPEQRNSESPENDAGRKF